MVMLQCSQMVLHDLLMATQPRRGRTASAHGHKIFGNVAGANTMHENQSQQVLKVGRDLIG